MKSLVFAVALLPTLALADADPRFAALRDQAEKMDAISAFVEKYVGNCASKMLGGGECENNAKVFREGVNGKKIYMIVTEGTSSVLSMGEVKMQGKFVLNLTPFFGASGLAITHNEPKGTDADGNPIMPFIRIESELPDMWNPAMLARNIEGLRLQIVFTPVGVWSIPKKGGGQIKGVKAKFDAVLVTVGKTGDQVGLWFGK